MKVKVRLLEKGTLVTKTYRGIAYVSWQDDRVILVPEVKSKTTQITFRKELVAVVVEEREP